MDFAQALMRTKFSPEIEKKGAQLVKEAKAEAVKRKESSRRDIQSFSLDTAKWLVGAVRGNTSIMVKATETKIDLNRCRRAGMHSNRQVYVAGHGFVCSDCGVKPRKRHLRKG